MSAASHPDQTPDREIPLPEIPATIRRMHENWALAYSRADEAERKLAEALRSADDWRAIALSNGDELARERVAHARTRNEVAARDSLLDKYGKEIASLKQRLHSDLAVYRDAIATIYHAVATGENLRDVIYDQMRALADCDDEDSDPLFDTCEACGPYDADENPMPGCRDCFGGKVVR